MRILVTPERLRELAQLLQQAQTEWQGQGSRLQTQYGGLDWDTRQKLNIEGQVQQATRLASDLTQRAGEKAAFLESAAARFEAADNQGAAVLGASVGSVASSWLQGLSSLPSWLRLSGAGLSTWERLSAWLGAPLGGIVSLPISKGDALVGLSFLASLPLLGAPLQSLAESVWNWLQGHGWVTNGEKNPSKIPTSPVVHGEQQTQRGQIDALHSPNLQPADPVSYTSCALYAQARRPDLGPTGGQGGAADYISKYQDKVFQISDQSPVDFQNHIATGYAIVWDRHVLSKEYGGWDYGHVAIVESVGQDYVVVSQANWPGQPTMKISREDFQRWNLYIIP